MSLTCCSLLSAVCAFTLVSAAGCGTDAQGVDECREIEQTRCVAAKSCGIYSDVEACQRYYRDQCLHGLPVPPPGSVKLKACVDVIRAAGVCADASGVDTPLRDCDPSLSSTSLEVRTACDLVKTPEKSPECSFLTGEDGSGGAGGGGGASSDEGGQGGASGADGG